MNVADECQGRSREGLRREWSPAPINFDWLGNALLACFTVASGDGWHTILYQGLDSVGPEGPDQNSNTAAILFFVPLQIAGKSNTDIARRCDTPRRRGAQRVQQWCPACFVSVGKLLLAVSAFSRARISMLAPHKHFYVVVAGFVFVTKLLLAVWCDTYSSIGAVTPEPIPPAPSRRRLPLWEFDTGPVAHPHRHGLFLVMLLVLA